MLEKIKYTVEVSSDKNDTDFCGDINNYLRKGYKLLHVGPHTTEVDDGLWHYMIAILGSEKVPVNDHKEILKFSRS